MQIWIMEDGSQWWDSKEQWNGKNKAQTLSALLKKAAQGTAQSQSQSAKLHFHLPPFMCFLITDVYFKVTRIQLVSELLLSLDLSHSHKPPEILCIEQPSTSVSKTILTNA